jgi:hypothetical protein
MDNQQQIQDLLRRIDKLNGQQASFQKTIQDLRYEVSELAQKLNTETKNAVEDSIVAITPVKESVVTPVETIVETTVETTVEKPILLPLSEVENTDSRTIEWFSETNFNDKTATSENTQQEAPPPYEPPFEVKKSLEAFIGEDLASKVGIFITVLGVGIGVKYAIDHDMISPWGRIIMGYLAGCGLMEASFRLRRKEGKYEDLSNIILGGGLASVFFVTYAAYSFYGLMPQAMAFALMVFIAGLTVWAALKYDKQIIAIGGLVGAYAIPFLLSTGEDKPITLFTYMAIINSGILFISFKKDWRLLHYLAFVFTWLVFIAWIGQSNYQKPLIAGVYLTVFFAIFYTIFLAKKFIKNENNSIEQTIILFLNAAFFFGFGYLILDSNAAGKHYLGVFALFNALVHLVISKFVYERNLADKNLFTLLSGLVVFFITVAIPIQFNGIYVTLLWAVEMLVLFLIGRHKNLSIYEFFTYPLWLLTSFSLVHDWVNAGYFNGSSPLKSDGIIPIFNVYLLTTILVITAFIFILNKLNTDEKDAPNFIGTNRELFNSLSNFVVLFITFAIIVQFNGVVVTILWVAEMLILFWIGRAKKLPVLVSASYPLWALITCSLAEDWINGGYFNSFPSLKSDSVASILNIYLLTTIIVIAAFVFVLYTMYNDEKDAINSEGNKNDKGDLFYFLSNCVVGFTTIAIVVLFDGVLATFLLAAEIAGLSWLNRHKTLPNNTISTYPLWVLTLFSLIDDWKTGNYPNASYWEEYTLNPLIFNIYSFISIVVIAAFIFIRHVHLSVENSIENTAENTNKSTVNIVLNSIILCLIYLLFYNEINNYFTHLDKSSSALFKDITDNNIERFRIIWCINYTLLFAGILSFINLEKYQNVAFAKVTGVLGLLAVFIFLSTGLYTLGTVKNAYLYHEQAEYFQRGIFGGLLLRYISFVLVIGVMYLLNQTKNTFFRGNKDIEKAFDIAVSVTLLWVMSSEMVHWLELSGYTQTYKWAISVLFGIFALGLVSYGISKKKKHLRIAAIVLFVLTLIKLFAFDLMGLDTIAKTIVLVSLGLLLLTISYVYTKFKDTLLGED